MSGLSRRLFLGGIAGASVSAAPRAGADDPVFNGDALASRTPLDLDMRDLTAPGPAGAPDRFTLYTPKHLAAGERVPLLVLFHGLSETWHPEIGVHAWVQRYGLGNAYARLRRPPVGRTSRDKTLLVDAKIAEINASLTARPFRGLAVACPFTPNFLKKRPDTAGLDVYATWIADVVVPRARREAPVFQDRAHTTLDGNSLGGYVGLEVFSRRPDVFGAWGGVHSALEVPDLARYADKLAASFAGQGGRVHIESSLRDPMLGVNTELSRLLSERNVQNELVVLPGEHNAAFLREAGAMEMLLWHDRRPR